MKLKSILIAAFIMMLIGFSQQSFAENTPVVISVRKPQPSHSSVPRTPIVIPEVYIDGYTLTFDVSCIGCPVAIVAEEENVVFTTYVDETGVVELPNDLTGIFELQLVRGSITFVGEIEL